MSRTILFVYGTLKSGLSGNHFLAGQEFLGEAQTIAQYRLYHISWHPGLVHDPENGLEIHGELWAVAEDCLAKLDEYEGVPTYFVRGPILIAHHFEEVQAYFFNEPVPPGSISGTRWPLE